MLEFCPCDIYDELFMTRFKIAALLIRLHIRSCCFLPSGQPSIGDSGDRGRHQRTAMFDSDSPSDDDLFGDSDDSFFDGEFDEMERNVGVVISKSII